MAHFDLSLLLAGQYREWLLAGLRLSLELTAIALILALPLAVAVALMRLSPVRLLRAMGQAFVEGIRNVPLLVHMLFWYFGAPELLPESLRERLNEGNFEALSAIVALTLYTAAYMSEDIRSGVRAIPSVQLEAGRALGFGYLASMRLIVLPQAVRIIVPPLISQTLNLWKNTSIATVIGVGELMYQAAKVETVSFRSAEAFSFATISYLSVSLIITGLGAWYQRRHPLRTA